ncbi:hypothetical protein [Streptomyces sp. CB00455]|uniref:hypothetical protein n=1 Tax=Streptomyces sp. CB00455 TaxID=1703927 RepID=UPI00093E008A|nr:hypothetical protein [Streptomyces sp. CB00455]
MNGHLDGAELADLALGGPAAQAVALAARDHAAACGRCAQELLGLRRAVRAARSLEPGDVPAEPPPGVRAAVLRGLHAGPVRPPCRAAAGRARLRAAGARRAVLIVFTLAVAALAVAFAATH